MKTFQWFKVAVAIGAGYELGRILPGVAIKLLHKSTIDEVKTRYREGVKKTEEEGKSVHLVDFTPKNDTETPTGD